MSTGLQGFNFSNMRMQESNYDSLNGLEQLSSAWNTHARESCPKRAEQWNLDQPDSSAEFDSINDVNHSFSSNTSSLLSNTWNNSIETLENEVISEQIFPFSPFHRQLERSKSTDTKSFSTFSLPDQESFTLSLPTELPSEDHRFKSHHRGLSRTASDPVTVRNPSFSSVNLSESLHGSSDTVSSAENGSVGRYKTELCRTFQENGKCKYGDKCQFAHGKAELRSLSRHPKYKTDRCKTYHSTGFCPYGPRCHFIHDDDDRLIVKSENQLIQEKLLDVIQRQQIEKKQQLQKLQQQQHQLQQKLLLTKILQSQNSPNVSKKLSENLLAFGESMPTSSSPSNVSNSPSSSPILSMYDGNDLSGISLSTLLAACNNSSHNHRMDGWSQQIIPNSTTSVNQKSQPYLSSDIQNSFNNVDLYPSIRNAAELSSIQAKVYSNPFSALPASSLADTSPADQTINDVILVAEVLKALNLNRVIHQHNRACVRNKSFIDLDLNPFANSPYICYGESTQL